MNDYFWVVAAVYGQGVYGSSTYGCSPDDLVCLSGQLADTGVPVVGIATAACLLIFASLLVFFWRRKHAR